MIAVSGEGLHYLQFPHMERQSGLMHAVFTRKGGNSTGVYDSLNVAFGVGDSSDAVQKNRKRIGRVLGSGRLRYLRQVHGTRVCRIDEGTGGVAPADSAGAGDAFMTAVPGEGLVIQTADCQAIVIYDPVRRVLANVHAGWRGSIQNVAARTVREMRSAYGVDPATMLVGIGPSLGPCCAEFAGYRDEIPERYWSYRNPGNNHFDFWAMTRDQLAAAGVRVENIVNSGICTRCRTDLFFSYRAERKTGRFATVALLR